MEFEKKISQQMYTPKMANGERYALCPITTTDEVVVNLPELEIDPGTSPASITLTTLLSGKVDGFSLGGGGGTDILKASAYPVDEQNALPIKKRHTGIWFKSPAYDDDNDLKAKVRNTYIQ